MSTYLISLLDLILMPFAWTSNIIVFVPTACLTCIFCLMLIKRLM